MNHHRHLRPGRRGGFHPPCCPNPNCPRHAPGSAGFFPRWGVYVRRSDGQRFQKFYCLQCQHQFSTRAFSPTYWLRRRDLLLRHGCANHRRETIAFSKRRQAAIERAALFTVWRNCIKSRRENDPGPTAAMAAGLLTRPLTWRQVLARRRFPAHVALPPSWVEYYWARIKTLAYGEHQRVHVLKWAF